MVAQTTTAAFEARTDRAAARRESIGRQAVKIMTTTDHKVIGNLYLVTSFAFFILGGLMALLIRAELAQPGTSFVDDETYNQLFTMHGIIMVFFFFS